MGIVNACEKSTKQVDNEVYLNGLNNSQNLPKRILKQNNSLQFQNNKPTATNTAQSSKNNYFKQQQENIAPIKELPTEESKYSKSTCLKTTDKGLIENSSMKVLKIEQNETKLLNYMYNNNLMNSTTLIDCSRNRQSQSHHVLGTRNDLLTQSNTFYNGNSNYRFDQDGTRSSRPSLGSSNINRSTYSQSIHVVNERKRVKEIYEDGSVYDGQVLNGLRDGQGTFTYSNQGAKYIGQWIKGNIEGYGILYFSNSRIAYEGQWRDNKFNGNGVVHNENDSSIDKQSSISYDYKNFDNIGDHWVKYDGNFVDDLKQGLGTLYLKNGEKFVGNFYKDSVNGNGAFYQLDGTIILGVWSNNILALETSRIKC